jgi:hypothetical protein
MKHAPLRSLAACALAAALLLTAGMGSVDRARACNACREDKIAATYDWQVVSSSQRRGHTVVFTAINGPVRPGDHALEALFQRTVGAVHGVDPGTVRVSLAPPAVSFACGEDQSVIVRVLAEINRRLHPRHLELAIVQIGAPRADSPVMVSRSGRAAVPPFPIGRP